MGGGCPEEGSRRRKKADFRQETRDQGRLLTSAATVLGRELAPRYFRELRAFHRVTKAILLVGRRIQFILKHLLGAAQLGGERRVDLATPVFIRIIPEGVVTVAIVLPAGMVQDRIKTNAMHRNTILDCRLHFAADIAQPAGADPVFGARFGDTDRPMVAGINFGEHFTKRTVGGICPADRRELAYAPQP